MRYDLVLSSVPNLDLYVKKDKSFLLSFAANLPLDISKTINYSLLFYFCETNSKRFICKSAYTN